MASKNYTEFPAGTYDTSKIFLQADPVTGSLEKVNCPVIATAGLTRIYASATPIYNLAGTETTFFDVNIAPGQMKALGDEICLKICIDPSTSASKTVKLYLNTTAFTLYAGTSTSTTWFIVSLAYITNTAGNLQTYLIQSNTHNPSGQTTAGAIDFAAGFNVKLTGTSATANTITLITSFIDYIPAP